MNLKIKLLFKKMLGNECSPKELTLLVNWFSDLRNREEAEKLIASNWNKDISLGGIDESLKLKLLEKIHAIQQKEEKELSPVISIFKKHRLIAVAVAASVMLLVCAGGWYMYNNQSKNNNSNYQVLAPTNNNAILELENGKKIDLNKLAIGETIVQGGMQITKMANGKLQYTALTANAGTAKLVYNTVSNPKGSKTLQLILSDSSTVWLNAGSSLKYPIAFAKNERAVALSGEGYFSVAKNKAKPFRVTTNVANKNLACQIEVLGTEFNVSSFASENQIQTTLINGSVKLSKLINEKISSTTMLTPRQQGLVSESNTININSNIDIDKILAWKENNFQFKNDNIYEICRQLAVWYDVEFSYSNIIDKSKTYSCTTMNRSVDLEQVLEILKIAGVKYKISNKTVTIIKN